MWVQFPLEKNELFLFIYNQLAISRTQREKWNTMFILLLALCLLLYAEYKVKLNKINVFIHKILGRHRIPANNNGHTLPITYIPHNRGVSPPRRITRRQRAYSMERQSWEQECGNKRKMGKPCHRKWEFTWCIFGFVASVV